MHLPCYVAFVCWVLGARLPVQAQDINVDGPLPNPNPGTSAKVSSLVRTLRARIIEQYTDFSTLYCYAGGTTFDCSGPWVEPQFWNGDYLQLRLMPNNEPDFSCSSDLSYLADESTRRFFYGFSAGNVTSSLSKTARLVALFAAGACRLDDACASLYSDNELQMYADYRAHIDSTFFEFLRTQLAQDSTKSYCPQDISHDSVASAFSWMTYYFEGSNEYFGFHNPIFQPGVAENLDMKKQSQRFLASQYLAQNIRRAEGVMLSMIFFTYNADDEPISKRSKDYEIFPGCSRHEWILKGKCEGVVPPRAYDLNGKFVSMKDRDQNETRLEPIQGLELSRFHPRQAGCPELDSIHSIETGIGVALAGLNSVAATLFLYSSSEALLAAGLAASPYLTTALALTGATWLVLSVAVDTCGAFNGCNGLPPALVEGVNGLSTALDVR